MIMDAVQIANASVPVVPAMPPIENRTRAGTPLATQKAPRQSMLRCNCPSAGCTRVVTIVLICLDSPFYVPQVTAATARGFVTEMAWTTGRVSTQSYFFLISED